MAAFCWKGLQKAGDLALVHFGKENYLERPSKSWNPYPGAFMLIANQLRRIPGDSAANLSWKAYRQPIKENPGRLGCKSQLESLSPTNEENPRRLGCKSQLESLSPTN